MVLLKNKLNETTKSSESLSQPQVTSHLFVQGKYFNMSITRLSAEKCSQSLNVYEYCAITHFFTEKNVN